MRGQECAASCLNFSCPLSSRSKFTPKASKSFTRAFASVVSMRAILSSTNPAPALMVSRACRAGLSPAPRATAMPPCAHALALLFSGIITVTWRCANFKAVNKPAKPPPTMRTSPASMILGRTTYPLNVIIRSTARRAFSATASSTSTSSRS